MDIRPYPHRKIAQANKIRYFDPHGRSKSCFGLFIRGQTYNIHTT